MFWGLERDTVELLRPRDADVMLFEVFRGERTRGFR
jgi:hypothetical protein